MGVQSLTTEAGSLSRNFLEPGLTGVDYDFIAFAHFYKEQP